jgi:hypothetical protein
MGSVEALFYAPVPAAGRMRLILYQRDDCKLCDEALAVLAAARAPDFESVWIDDDLALEARYGERIPVLRDAAGERELAWPFDADDVRRFLGAG